MYAIISSYFPLHILKLHLFKLNNIYSLPFRYEQQYTNENTTLTKTKRNLSSKYLSLTAPYIRRESLANVVFTYFIRLFCKRHAETVPSLAHRWRQQYQMSKYLNKLSLVFWIFVRQRSNLNPFMPYKAIVMGIIS